MRKQIVTTSSGATNPKPFASLNHVTVRLPSFFLYKFAERATVASRERAMGHHDEQLFMARQRGPVANIQIQAKSAPIPRSYLRDQHFGRDLQSPVQPSDHGD